MTFKKCSIRDQVYGDDNDQETDIREQLLANADDNQCIGQANDFVWRDQKLLETINKNDNPYVYRFLSVLAICHTVVSEEKNGKIIYQAQSPDENALVIAARTFGFEFLVDSSAVVLFVSHGSPFS